MPDLSRECNAASIAALDTLLPLVVAGASDADIMVMLETTLTVGLLFSERVFYVDRRVTAERLEAMVERVMERLAAHTAKERQS